MSSADRTLTLGNPEALRSSIPCDLDRPEAERYRLVHEHARGGGGKIYVAHDLRFGREVAVKEPLVATGDVRFLNEAMVTAQLEHPTIVPVHDGGRRPDGTPFYVMKLVSGRSLRDAIAGATDLPARLALLRTWSPWRTPSRTRTASG